MTREDAHTKEIWRIMLDNLSTTVTIVTALVAVILAQLNFISHSVLPSITIGLLALLATSHLIDSRRALSSLSTQIEHLSREISTQDDRVTLRPFLTADGAVDYLAERTKSAHFSVDQASLDKQRARGTPVRLRYEKAREELILSDRVKYRYLGIVDDQRRFRSVLSIMEKGPLGNFYAAFQKKPDFGLPLLSFTVFDKEEVIVRAPYATGDDPLYLAIRSREIAALFLGYFQKLWEGAKKVDTSDEVKRMLSDYRSSEVVVT